MVKDMCDNKECNKDCDIQVRHFWVKNQLPSKLCTNSIYFVKVSSGVLMYVTSITGVPSLIGSTAEGEVSIVSPDSSITIEQDGQNFEISISDTLQSLIESALQPGDNVSALENDAGYITSLPPTPSLQQVTTVGQTTTNSISVTGQNKSLAVNSGAKSVAIAVDVSGEPTLNIDNSVADYFLYTSNVTGNVIRQVANNSGNEVLSINGNTADTSGNVTVPISSSTNLTYTPSSTQGTVNSDTGTDAVIPLANGTNAGLSSDNFTTAEKTKLSGIEAQATRLLLGETSTTAYRGDRGKTAYDHSQTTGNPHNTQISDITNLQTTIDAKVAQTITNGVTASAPSQDVVFDALVLKESISNKLNTYTVDGTGTKYYNTDYINNSFKTVRTIVADTTAKPLITALSTVVATYPIPALPSAFEIRVKAVFFKTGTAATTVVGSTFNGNPATVIINQCSTASASLYVPVKRSLAYESGTMRYFPLSGFYPTDDTPQPTTGSYTGFNPALTTNTIRLECSASGGDSVRFVSFLVEVMY